MQDEAITKGPELLKPLAVDKSMKKPKAKKEARYVVVERPFTLRFNDRQLKGFPDHNEVTDQELLEVQKQARLSGINFIATPKGWSSE